MGAATRFLQSKVQGPIRVHGNLIEIENEKARDVKLLLHKFLRHEGLTDYRVLSQSGRVRVAPDNRTAPAEHRRDDKIRGIPPFPPISPVRLAGMDTVYPNYTYGLPSKFKKGKR